MTVLLQVGGLSEKPPFICATVALPFCF